MSIRNAIVIRIARLAKFFVERRKATLFSNINENGRRFRKVHEERRESLSLADENCKRAIEDAKKQAEIEKQECSRIAEARAIRLQEQESKQRADLYELVELD